PIFKSCTPSSAPAARPLVIDANSATESKLRSFMRRWVAARSALIDFVAVEFKLNMPIQAYWELSVLESFPALSATSGRCSGLCEGTPIHRKALLAKQPSSEVAFLSKFSVNTP